MKYLSNISDINTSKYKYFVFSNQSFSYQGYDYGPPDPPGGSIEHKHLIEIVGFESDSELRQYLESSKGKIRIFTLKEVKVTTTVSIELNE